MAFVLKVILQVYEVLARHSSSSVRASLRINVMAYMFAYISV